MRKRVILALLLCAALLLVSCSESGDEEASADTAPETESGTEATPETSPETEPETTPETAPETTPESETPTLLFEDDFDGDELDTTKWERCPEWSRQGGAGMWYDSLSYLDGEGHLTLRAEWNDEEKLLYSGAVRTNGKFTASYGYYEASIKLPVCPGVWGAFWMMVGDVSNVDGSAADGVEIDIIESIGNENGQCNHALHWDGYDTDHQKTAKEMRNRSIYDGEYHTFGLWRTEEEYIFYIDGEESWRVSGDECAICPKEGYMKLTVEGAGWAGLGTSASVSALPSEMSVDWVRVYSEKP